MTLSILALSSVLAASGDVAQPPKDCAEYAHRYRDLLRDAAVRSVESHQPDQPRAEQVWAVTQVAAEIDRTFADVQPEVDQSCQRANRSQYECVVDAGNFDVLAACMVPGLPGTMQPSSREASQVR